MLRDEREETGLSLNYGGMRAGIARKMTMTRPRTMGKAYEMQRRMISLYRSDRGGPGDAGLLSTPGGMAWRSVIWNFGC
ncbi:hypothetical protein NL676_008489 [Syzygium grande]|nr:hypothetical protein NL676_008489 [Syzygium grande]